MKENRIHLSQPFEHVLAAVLSLPKTRDDTMDSRRQGGAELRELLRRLYEAANGRQVETTIGLVPIAPPVAAYLKETPFEVETQLDFLLEAMSRMIAPLLSSGVWMLYPRRLSRETPRPKRDQRKGERNNGDRNPFLSTPSLFPHRYSSISR